MNLKDFGEQLGIKDEEQKRILHEVIEAFINMVGEEEDAEDWHGTLEKLFPNLDGKDKFKVLALATTFLDFIEIEGDE